MLMLRHALVRQHYGRALKIMMKQSEDKATKEVDGRMVEASESLESIISLCCNNFITYTAVLTVGVTDLPGITFC